MGGGVGWGGGGGWGRSSWCGCGAVLHRRHRHRRRRRRRRSVRICNAAPHPAKQQPRQPPPPHTHKIRQKGRLLGRRATNQKQHTPGTPAAAYTSRIAASGPNAEPPGCSTAWVCTRCFTISMGQNATPATVCSTSGQEQSTQSSGEESPGWAGNNSSSRSGAWHVRPTGAMQVRLASRAGACTCEVCVV